MQVDETTDADLVRLFKRGDADAFATLVARHQDRLFRLALVWLRDKQQAADAVQEVFLRAHGGLNKFQFRAAPFSWLYRTAYNVCREFNRAHRFGELVEEAADRQADLEQHAMQLQTAQQVAELVAGLPSRQQQVVLLRVFEELSVRETANLMGCREGTVKALLHKAVAQLKRNRDKLP